jgi:hypothetical protein
MKAISLHQPWASLIAAGVKVHETRSWAPPPEYVGRRIAIHAAARPVNLHELSGALAGLCESTFGSGWEHRLPRGALVCTAILEAYGMTQLLLPSINFNEGAILDTICGDWSAGRWAWELSEVEKLTPPIPERGHQRWWTVDL